jgi:hypothetical protein
MAELCSILVGNILTSLGLFFANTKGKCNRKSIIEEKKKLIFFNPGIFIKIVFKVINTKPAVDIALSLLKNMQLSCLYPGKAFKFRVVMVNRWLEQSVKTNKNHPYPDRRTGNLR